jgi:protein-S-isoprenylcysteine O-methyltransferase Ste14
MVNRLFLLGLATNLSILALIVLGHQKKTVQIWPPPSKQSWQYRAIWAIFGIVMFCVVGLCCLDFSSWQTPPLWLRHYIALPLAVITLTVAAISSLQLGWRNTQGEANGFIEDGIYRYSRNPQCVCCSVGWICLGIWVASIKALILLFLIIVWYFRAIFVEERWLYQQ